MLGNIHLQLEFIMLDWDRVTKNEVQLAKQTHHDVIRYQALQVIGKLELGKEGNEGSQLHHWTEIQVFFLTSLLYYRQSNSTIIVVYSQIQHSV